MNLILGLATLVSLAIVNGQQSEKGSSIGRSDRFFLADKRNSPGLIPFPRIGRSGIHEGKRQLIPFPRVGKRVLAIDPYFLEYEDSAIPNSVLSSLVEASNNNNNDLEDNETEKRNGSPTGSGGMWFGPRLGRRKRSVTESDSTSAEKSRESLDIQTLAKILHNFSWAIVPINKV